MGNADTGDAPIGAMKLIGPLKMTKVKLWHVYGCLWHVYGCLRHASDMPQTCPRHASDDAPDMPQMMPQTCSRWCPRHINPYVTHISPLMSPRCHPHITPNTTPLSPLISPSYQPHIIFRCHPHIIKINCKFFSRGVESKLFLITYLKHFAM